MLQTSRSAASCDAEKYYTPHWSWNSLDLLASRIKSHLGSVALSTALRGSMNSGSGQFCGTISTIPCHAHVANLGPRANFAALFRSQLALLGRTDGQRARRGLGIWSLPATMTATIASRGPRRRCQAGAAWETDMMSLVGFFLSLMYGRKNHDGNAFPRPDGTNPVDGVGCNRGRSE